MTVSGPMAPSPSGQNFAPAKVAGMMRLYFEEPDG
jgi:hypothetical protein